MQTSEEMLEVVDEDGKVVGIENRKKIHTEGLLHKEVHVIFVTPKREVVFQHREKNKASMPDKLDATAGGHVDPGEDTLTAALREAVEETGLEINKGSLVFGGIARSKIYEPNTGVTNNVMRDVYGYLFEGEINDLKIEVGQAVGFVKYDFEKLKNLSEEEKAKFIPERYEKMYLDIYEEIFKKLNI